MPNWRHSTAIFSPSSNRAMNLSRSSMRLHSFQGIFALPQKAQLCNPCLRNEVSPFSQEGHFVLQDDVPPAQLDRSCEILIRAGVIAPEISVLAAQNTRDRRTRACLPSASASASRSPPERASAFGLLTGAGIRGQPLEPFR